MLILRDTGYPGVKVSSDGRVFKNGRELRQSLINSGYLIVQVYGQYRDGNRVRELVHRLVGKAFVKGYRKGLQINHKDANRINNHFKNLEWVTQKGNIRDCMKRGTHNVSRAQGVAKIANLKPVDQYSVDGEFIKRWDSIKQFEEEVYGKKSKVGMVANGKRNSCYGYKWKWANDDDIV